MLVELAGDRSCDLGCDLAAVRGVAWVRDVVLDDRPAGRELVAGCGVGHSSSLSRYLAKYIKI